MNAIPNNVIRQLLILAFIIILGYILFRELQFFLPSLLGAYTLYVILRKYQFILVGKDKWNKNLAAGLLMLLSFLIILLPIFILINMLSSKIAFAVSHSNEVIASFQKFIQKYEDQYNYHLLTPENTQKVSDWLGRTLTNLLTGTFNTLTIVATMYFMLFFMLTQGRKMESAFYEWVPLKDENVLLLRNDMNGMVLSNAIGIPLIAFIQGIVGLIGYYFIGVKEPVFWFVITCVTAMLPVIGAAFAYVPLAVLFFANGDTGRGIIMLVYGFGVIGLVDNFFRFWIAKKVGDVHPLITVFGVIAGVNLFGFIGIIFGPILLALFLLLIKIYLNEFSPQKPKSGVMER